MKKRPIDLDGTVINAVNNQANFVSNRQTTENGGIPIKMTGGIQAPLGCYGQMTNQSQAALKGISNARDALEVSKSAYGTFKHLHTLQEKNNLQHLALQNIRNRLQGKAFQI